MREQRYNRAKKIAGSRVQRTAGSKAKNGPQKPQWRRCHVILRGEELKNKKRNITICQRQALTLDPGTNVAGDPRKWNRKVRPGSQNKDIKKYQRLARRVGAGRSGRGSCGLWCKACKSYASSNLRTRNFIMPDRAGTTRTANMEIDEHGWVRKILVWNPSIRFDTDWCTHENCLSLLRFGAMAGKSEMHRH